MNPSILYLNKLIYSCEHNIDSYGTYRLLIMTIIINLNNDLNNLNKYEFKAFKDLIIKNNNLRRYYRNYLKSEKRLEREYKLKRLASLKSRA